MADAATTQQRAPDAPSDTNPQSSSSKSKTDATKSAARKPVYDNKTHSDKIFFELVPCNKDGVQELEMFVRQLVQENASFIAELHRICRLIDREEKDKRILLYELMKHQDLLRVAAKGKASKRNAAEAAAVAAGNEADTVSPKKAKQTSAATIVTSPEFQTDRDTMTSKHFAKGTDAKSKTVDAHKPAEGQAIRRDKHGKPILPLKLGYITICSLGKIDPKRKNYHNFRHIFPIGFKSKRLYANAYLPKERVEYTFEILDGGESPLFRVTAPTEPPFEVKAESVSKCHKAILDTLNKTRDKPASSTTPSGPDFFGLGNRIVVDLLQELKGFSQCQKFRRRGDKRTKQETSTSSSKRKSRGAEVQTPEDDEEPVSSQPSAMNADSPVSKARPRASGYAQDKKSSRQAQAASKIRSAQGSRPDEADSAGEATQEASDDELDEDAEAGVDLESEATTRAASRHRSTADLERGAPSAVTADDAESELPADDGETDVMDEQDDEEPLEEEEDVEEDDEDAALEEEEDDDVEPEDEAEEADEEEGKVAEPIAAKPKRAARIAADEGAEDEDGDASTESADEEESDEDEEEENVEEDDEEDEDSEEEASDEESGDDTDDDQASEENKHHTVGPPAMMYQHQGQFMEMHQPHMQPGMAYYVADAGADPRMAGNVPSSHMMHSQPPGHQGPWQYTYDYTPMQGVPPGMDPYMQQQQDMFVQASGGPVYAQHYQPHQHAMYYTQMQGPPQTPQEGVQYVPYQPQPPMMMVYPPQQGGHFQPQPHMHQQGSEDLARQQRHGSMEEEEDQEEEE